MNRVIITNIPTVIEFLGYRPDDNVAGKPLTFDDAIRFSGQLTTMQSTVVREDIKNNATEVYTKGALLGSYIKFITSYMQINTEVKKLEDSFQPGDVIYASLNHNKQWIKLVVESVE